MGLRNGATIAGIVAAALTPAVLPSIAQAAEGQVQSLTQAPPAQGVVSYLAADFADARPATAYDMILRLPGFTFDIGAQVRGFADGAGNVLIDGERPTSKQDDLKQILRRIPASEVERIDVIHGSAPGIDMQGRTLMANVIRKRGSGSAEGAVTLQDRAMINAGDPLPQTRIEWSKRQDDHSLEFSLFSGRFVDDGSGSGPHATRDGYGNLLDGYNLSTKARDTQTSLTGAYEGPLLGGKFKVNAALTLENYIDHEDDLAYFPGPEADDTYKDAQDSLRSELGLHYTRDFGSKLTLETLAIQQLSRSHEHSYYAAFQGQPEQDDEIYSNAIVNAESIARATLRYHPTATLTIEGALEGAYNTEGVETSYFVNGALQDLPAALSLLACSFNKGQSGIRWSRLLQWRQALNLRPAFFGLMPCPVTVLVDLLRWCDGN